MPTPRVRPSRAKRSIISTNDIDHKTVTAEIPEFGSPDFEAFETVPAAQLVTAAEEAKFMEDKIEVLLETSGMPDSAVYESAGHNGIMQFFERGKPQVVKRKFLYSLLAAKTVTIACNFGRGEGGNEFNRVGATPKTTHSVRLLRDDNPKGGMAWFQKVAAEAIV